MKKDHFQQELLFFVRNSTEAITPPNIAYYFKINVEEARKHLEDLSNENVVLFDSDDDGNLLFTIPNTPRKNNAEKLEKHFFSKTTPTNQIQKPNNSNRYNVTPSLRAHEQFIICPNPNCQYQGIAIKKKRGSVVILILLFLFYMIPGILYLLFGYGTRYYCPKCGIRIDK